PELRSHPRARSHWWASVPGGIVCSIRTRSLNPTPDAAVVGGDAPLGEKCLDVPLGKGESQIPAHRTGNDGRFEVPHFNKGGLGLHTKASYQGRASPLP